MGLRINQTNSIKELHFIWSAKEAIYKILNNQPCSFKDNINISALGGHILRFIWIFSPSNLKSCFIHDGGCVGTSNIRFW